MIKEEDKEKFIEQYKNYMMYQTKASFSTGKQKEIYELAAISNLLALGETRKEIESYNEESISEESNFFDIFSKMHIYRHLKEGNKQLSSQEEILNRLENITEENKMLKDKLDSLEKNFNTIENQSGK